VALKDQWEVSGLNEGGLPVAREREKQGLYWYLVLTFGLVWLMEGWLWTQGGLRHPSAQLVLMAVMLVPAVSAAVVRQFVTREGFSDAGLRLGKKRYYLWAWLLPLILASIAGALTVALGQARYDPTMSEFIATLKTQSPAVQVPAPEVLLPMMLVQGMTVNVLITAVFAFGEEFGWRGYLLMKLLPLGRIRALVVSGVIWGLWHAPVILMGYNYPTQPVWGVLLMTVFCTWFAAIFGWLRLASGSVFTATLAHAALNSGALTPLTLLAGVDTAIGGPLGVIGWIPLGAFVLWLHFTGRLYDTAAD